VPALRHEDVGGLDVAMDDPFLVRGIERIRNLNTDTQKALQFHGPIANQMLQGCAVKELHRDEGLA
jgi:hypothetical protein